MWRQIYGKWEEIAVFLETGAENSLQSFGVRKEVLMEIRRKKEVGCVKKEEENRYSKRKMNI